MGTQTSSGDFQLGRRRFLALPLAGGAATAIASQQAHASTAQPRRGDADVDIVLRGGTVIDGSGASRFVADVGIDNGHIVKVGDLAGTSGEVDIDAAGLVVCPGFIDVHSHGSLAVIRGAAESSLRQGVTTEILHPDGGGILRIAHRLSGDLEEQGIAINAGAYIGFNAVWRNVVGEDDRRATPEEIAQGRRRVASGLENGAWGVSAGLYYTPAFFAETDQVIDITKAARPWRTNFPNHIRSENNEVIDATAETIEIGEGAGIVPVITHMKVMGPANWGKSVQTIGLIQDAIARGTYAAADQYPYLRSQTGINATIPQWIRDGGEQAMFDRFNDPNLRPQIIEEIEELMHSRVSGPEDVWVRTLGQTVAEASETRWDDSPVRAGEAVIRIRVEVGNASCIWTFGHEDDYRRILLNPTTAVASDGGASTSTTTHSRRYGTQPRVLGRYSRDEGLLDLEEAVYKMTYLPATMIGMVDRGLLAPGMAADVTVFDPDTVIDKSTFEEPLQYAEGIEHVIINGQLAMNDGLLTGARVGRSLRRSAGMISRPATGDQRVRAQVNGRLVPPKRPKPDGSVFTADFSTDDIGQAPAGWTSAWRDGDWTVLDGPRRLRMNATSGRRALTWDAVGDVDRDAEVFGIVRGSGHMTLFQLGLMISGDADGENSYFLRARLEDADTANQLQIFRYRDGDGGFTQVSKVMPFQVREDNWYRVLFHREGDFFRGKMWPDGEDEPLDWQVEVSGYETDELGGSGAVGPLHCCSGATNDWKFISVGTGGKRAPRPDGDPPPATNDWDQAQVAFRAQGEGMQSNGNLVFIDRSRRLTFRSDQFGKLQVADGWASLTGRGHLAGDSDDRSFLLILDENDLMEDGKATVTVEIEDGYRLKGILTDGISNVQSD